jgi:hypothetical protein
VLLRAIDVVATADVHDRHNPAFVVDLVDDAAGAAPRAQPVAHRRGEPLSDPVRLSQERTRDELVGCRGDGLRWNLAEGTADRRCRTQLAEVRSSGPPVTQTLGDELKQAGLTRAPQTSKDLDDWGVYEGFDPVQIQRTVNQVHTQTPVFDVGDYKRHYTQRTSMWRI